MRWRWRQPMGHAAPATTQRRQANVWQQPMPCGAAALVVAATSHAVVAMWSHVRRKRGPATIALHECGGRSPPLSGAEAFVRPPSRFDSQRTLRGLAKVVASSATASTPPVWTSVLYTALPLEVVVRCWEMIWRVEHFDRPMSWHAARQVRILWCAFFQGHMTRKLSQCAPLFASPPSPSAKQSSSLRGSSTCR